MSDMSTDERFEIEDDLFDHEEEMTPEEINRYIAEKLDENEIELDLDHVRELVEYCIGEKVDPVDWDYLTGSRSFEQFLETVEGVVRFYAMAEGLIY